MSILHWVKFLIGGWIKMTKKKRFFKRLKNIESKIKNEDKKESKTIKNEEQSEPIEDQSTMADKKPKEIVLLKHRLDNIFKNSGTNFDSAGKKFLENLAKDEKKIDYNNLFFNIDDKPVVKIVDFLEEIGALYDLLIYLLDNSRESLFLQKLKSISLK